MTPLVSSKNITRYIPQKAPIIMVGELMSNDENQTVSRLNIEAKNIFCTDGLFMEPGLIENIAQTAALRMGYTASQTEGNEKAPKGFIGAVSKLKVHGFPKVGDTLETTVDIKNEIFGIILIQGISRVNGEIMAECEMKIFVEDE
ncbi:hypothetical protein [Owenweeksia hongkongensis]|uniref:hypothetical protein n=1 Tax=Owenweeksia hongkongensis TaxID=253245 RepID=UPI003A90898E